MDIPETSPATIVSIERSMFIGHVTLTATLTDGTSERLFSFYMDELSFRDDELKGLTVDAARRLRHKRDVAYLRS